MDTSAPEYLAFEEKLYRSVLDRMGFEELLAPEHADEKMKQSKVLSTEEITELKLYSPFSAVLYEEDPEEETETGFEPLILSGYELTGYQDAIRQGIEDERLPDEEERGLMTYFDGDKSVDEKVISVQMDAEEVLGSLYAVAAK